MLEQTYPYEEDLPILKLRADVKNPRLPDGQDSQLDALYSMARDQEDKLITLAKHIKENRLNPAERFITIPDDNEFFIVLDGNRRITALRALETPEIFSGRLTRKVETQLKQLAKEYAEDPIIDVPCVIFENREKADTWIELIHDGESGGAGLVKWGAQQRSRYHSRIGTKPFHLQIFDYVREEKKLSDVTRKKIEAGKYPTSTLKRVLNTPYVREKLGIDKKDGYAFTKFPKKEVLKGLFKIVDEIGSGEVKVGKVMTHDDRKKYIAGFGDNELPDPVTEGDDSILLENAPETSSGNGAKRSKPKEKQHSSLRKKLIPPEVTFKIDVTRLNDIYIELKRHLLVGKTPNAVAVLLRAFLEMSVDEYMDLNSILIPKNDSLANKIIDVANYMEKNKILKKGQLKPIRRAASNSENPYSTTTLNGYVHNRRFTPGPDDLKANWDTLQIFFEKIWE